jgi:hypothetical protein
MHPKGKRTTGPALLKCGKLTHRSVVQRVRVSLRRLRYPGAAQNPVAIVEDGGLAGGDGALGLVEP